VEDDDLPLILQWQNSPNVWWSMDYERPFSAADIRADIERARREGHPLVIIVEGRPIGRIGLTRLEPRDPTCSVSLYIGEPDFRGRGYACDALMTMLAYAFDRLDLHLVQVRTLATNDRAIRLFERCGFVREAELRDRSWKDGRWLDHVEMSVTRNEFATARETWDSETERPA
jgi:RimJ/RimL family protein N-acetyltransferase